LVKLFVNNNKKIINKQNLRHICKVTIS